MKYVRNKPIGQIDASVKDPDEWTFAWMDRHTDEQTLLYRCKDASKKCEIEKVSPEN